MDQTKDFSSKWTVGIGKNDTRKTKVLTKTSASILAPHVSQAVYPPFGLKYFWKYSINLHSGLFFFSSVCECLTSISPTSPIFHTQLYPQFSSEKETQTNVANIN